MRLPPAWAVPAIERMARAVHVVHGTRGLGVAAAVLLVASIVEPGLPTGFPRALFVVPAFLLFATGLLTLPREGIAAQDRAFALLDAADPVRPMVRRLVWLGIAVVLLMPRLFLAAYGIPHLNPLTGLVLPDWQRRMALAFLFLVMLAPILYLRSSRRYAPQVEVRRPKDIDADEGGGLDRRDVLLILTYLLLAAWLLLLAPFWRPFSLFAWPPGLGSLTVGVRGVAALAFAVTVPLVLFMSLVAHIALLRRLRERNDWPPAGRVRALAILHLALILVAVLLHAYDLLWIARYENLVRF